MQKSLLSVESKKSMDEFDNSKSDNPPSIKETFGVVRNRRSLFKQSTLLNDKSMLKDVMDAHASNIKPLSSFQHKTIKEHWKLCIFELGKRQYHSFENKMSANYNIPIVPEDETLIVCVNFSHKELKTLLIDKLEVNPIMYYE